MQPLSINSTASVRPERGWPGFAEFLTRYEPIIFGLLLLAHLFPVFMGAYFPTADGPSHLYNSYLLKNLIAGDSFVEQFHMINTRLDPNWFSHILLASLLTFLSESTAEKLILCLYLISFPVAIRFVMAQLNYRATFLSILAFPFLYNYVFQFGFYNYCLSLVFMFLIIGYWLKINYRFTDVNAVILLTLITLVYITHPVSYLFSGLVLGTLTLERFVPSRARTPDWKQFGKNTLRLALFYLPTGLLMLYYLWSHRGQNGPDLSRDFFLYLYKFITLDAIRFMGGAEKMFVVVLLLLFLWGGLIAFRQVIRKQFSYSVSLLIVLTISLLLYVFMPDALAGGGYIKPRLALTFYLFLILFFATVYWPVNLRGVFLLCSLFFSGTLLAWRVGEYQKVQAGVEEILGAQKYIKPHSVILPLKFDALHRMPNQGEISFKQELNPFTHIVSYLPIGRDAIHLANYEARTFYFPLLWHYERIPDFGQLGQLDQYVPSSTVNIEKYEATIKQSIDYVIIMGLDTLSNRIYQDSLSHELTTHFHPVYTSPNRLVRVYEKVEQGVEESQHLFNPAISRKPEPVTRVSRRDD